MTYLIRPLHRPPLRRRAGGLAGIWEDLQAAGIGKAPDSEEIACLNEANAKVAPLDARILNLAKTWKPTGFYTPDQIGAIVSEGMKLGSSANDAVRAAPLSTGDAAAMTSQALKDVWRKFEESKKYTLAANEARAKGVNVVNAPGLRDWALGMMTAASQSLVTAAVMECRMSWLATLIIRFQGIFEVAANVFRKIVGVAVAVGQTVLNVAGDLPQIWTVVKWGGLAAIGLFAAVKLRDYSRRG